MKRFKNIVYFADGAFDTCPALERAMALSANNHARLTVIDVIEENDSPPEVMARVGSDLNEIIRDYRQRALEALAAPYTDADSLIYTQVLSGKPFVEVIKAVIQNGYDLLIKPARPPEGFSERLLGSTDLHLMRKCPCPVWVDRPGSANPYRRIVAAVDPTGSESDHSDRLIMDLATSLAERETAELDVVHAWRVYGESMMRSGRGRISASEQEQVISETERFHREALDALLRDYGMSSEQPNVHCTEGQPSAIIHRLSRDLEADLVVMGTAGRTGIPGFFIGNTAEEVLQAATASVLAVKPFGFVSPVELAGGG